MKPETFEMLRQTIKNHSGIALDKEKEYLIRSRFDSLYNRNNHATLDDFVKWTRENNQNWEQFVSEQLATHETYFFRDPDMHDDLRIRILPEILAKGQPRIWSIGCSSGQEPVSISFTINQLAPERTFSRAPILATDFSTRIIEKAKAGIYSQYEVQRGLPVRFLLSGFDQMQTDWIVKPNFRSMIDYRVDNLFSSQIADSNFDLILCRNVLIYFTLEDRRAIINALYEKLSPGGYLILGSAETLFGISDKFQKVHDVKSIINKRVG